MDKNESNFLDSKTLLAIALVGVVWFSWQSYLGKKYPHTQAPQKVETKSSQNSVDAGKEGSVVNSTLKTDKEAQQEQKSQPSLEEFLDVKSQMAAFKVSSRGLAVKEISLLKFFNRNKTNIKFSANQAGGIFSLKALNSDEPIEFSKISKTSDLTVVGKGSLGKSLVVRTVEYNPENYSYLNKVTISEVESSFKGIEVEIPEDIQEAQSSNFLIPSYEHQEFAVFHSGDKQERINISSAKENIDKTFQNVSVAGVGSQYFTTAISDSKSEIIPEVHLTTNAQKKTANLSLIYKPATLKDKFEFSFITYAGPKDRPTLEKADVGFVNLVNFGFFSAIGKVLLVVLKMFHGAVGNWGLSIILLTVLVRFIVLPFNIASYKSMKKMQKVQPMIQSLRDRYKDDPTSLNREMMLLMKNNKVNPLGGCLPMLLQMPIFFALFQVLGNSIELYQAPFVFWIQDLSLKDPFYVLPILMGLTLWIQHKITPTTMDPAQAKVMQFMPVLFSLMMVSLPSGLTLYTFVSTLFGITQQRIFMKDKHATKIVTN